MRRRHRVALITAAAALLTATVLATGQNSVAAADPAPAAGPPAACELDRILRPCPGRALFGSWAKGYVTGTFQDQVASTEQRYGGRRLDVVHTYHAPANSPIPFGNDKWGVAERQFAREGRIVLANFKPGLDFSAVKTKPYEDTIRAAARNIKAVSPHKVMLALYHEPENDISGGTTCPGLKGTIAGNTPQAYREMWRHTRALFDQEGVDNVVWVMNYMSLPHWDCLVDELWPGDGLVDWVGYDPYSVDGTTSRVTRFADLLTEHSRPRTDGTVPPGFTDKPWLLAEYGVNVKDQAKAHAFYDNLGALLEAQTVPNLQALVVFDSQTGTNGLNFGVGVDAAGVADPKEQAAFNRLASHPRFLPTVVN